MQFNLTKGITPVSHDIYLLHMTVLAVCAVIGIIVFGTLIYSIIYHRKSKHPQAARYHENLWIELTWTIIPFLILIALAIPGTRVLRNINNNSEKTDLTIVITGFQWKWKYEYLHQGISFFSNMSTPIEQLAGHASKNINYLREVDKPLVLPIHKRIQFLVTSNDVIHAWWVPELGVKRDAVPGFINETWTRINRPGIYRGQCAELCGINHALMPIVVNAVSEKSFDDWMSSQKGAQSQTIASTNEPTSIKAAASSNLKAPMTTKNVTATPAVTSMSLEQSIAKGKAIYMNTCAVCHKPDGSGSPPVFPDLITSPVVNGPVDKHINKVVFGVPGTAMQPFGQQFSPEDIAAVITYERNEIGHKKGEMVKPEDIIAAEKGTANSTSPTTGPKP